MRPSSPFEREYLADPRREAVNRYLEELDAGRVPHPEIEDAFCGAVVRYSIRLGLSADAWRGLGVPDPLLRRVGME